MTSNPNFILIILKLQMIDIANWIPVLIFVKEFPFNFHLGAQNVNIFTMTVAMLSNTYNALRKSVKSLFAHFVDAKD